ncbi:MAG: hypothetical protein VX672_04990 [Planctomycetota bacterium]|nr:hypothetical protein [Planctomycetota bacterium]
MASRPRTSIGVVIPVHGDFERMIESVFHAVAMRTAEPAGVVVVVD